MKPNLIPKSKAKTAFGLLGEVIKLILAEPLRYDQHEVLVDTEVVEVDDEQLPECGLIGCAAGWVYVLKRRSAGADDVIAEAATILGLNDRQLNQLVSPTAAGQRWDRSSGRAVATLRSIQAHARRGARHIERFRQRHAKQLKAKRV